MGETNFFFLIERLANLLRAEQRRLGTAHGLQPVHLQILSYLGQANRFSNTPAAVGEYLGITKGTVSQSLRVLERKGYIRKLADSDDRRVVRLLLSPSGQKLLAEMRSSPMGADEALQVAAGLTEKCGSALEHLLFSLQERHGNRTFGVCATCRHLLTDDEGEAFRCGLTRAPLSVDETHRICYEHARPEAD